LKFKMIKMNRIPAYHFHQTGRNMLTIALITIMVLLVFTRCSSRKNTKALEFPTEKISSNLNEESTPIFVELLKGSDHNHPLMAIWIEDLDGAYIETLFVAESYGTGIFGHGQVTEGNWEPGPVSRPAALPYWWHKYGYLPTPDKPVPDAITGPTPKAGFILEAGITEEPVQKFKVMAEVNQSWDWNAFWTNDKYPDNEDYKTSSQPAVIYEAVVDPGIEDSVYIMHIAGHSHYAGEDGNLYKDFTTLTTARNIFGLIRVSIGENRLD